MIPGPVAEGTHTAEALAPLEVDGQPLTHIHSQGDPGFMTP